MARRTYYKGGRVDVWRGADSSWCAQAIHKDNEIFTKAGFDSPRSAITAAREAIDKAIQFNNHVFKIF